MKRIGGCPAGFFCPAACEVAAPIGKLNRRKPSNIRKNRYLRCKRDAKRTIKSPQLYMLIRLAIASYRSKSDFDVSRRLALPEVILFPPGAAGSATIPPQEKSKIPQRYLHNRDSTEDARNCVTISSQFALIGL
ncbi:hypothetical protein [Rhizobium lentis]|uniref:hypothetical protein n=1 Tax=Rhizobium lentis TaxID=1138194 RepID=UPI001FE538AA|nr:hypothetical protein [Rhizobium lentis]